jgi:hypothetical protein
MQAVSEKAAKEMLSRMVDVTGAEIDEEQREHFIRAIQHGRLDFDADSEAFTVYLRKPVDLDNGEALDRLEISEPTAGQMRQAARANDDFEQTLRLISLMTGHPVTVIERMRARDLTLAGGVLGFFA